MFSKNSEDQSLEQNYIVLARRTRPQSLSELVGQEVVANSIANMLSSKKIPHAFLFTGTRGTGKTSSARILAKSLCCEKGPTSTPCQTCVHCRQITVCSHDDVLEIDGASNTGVDNVRELNEAARFYPHSARFKIFIIDEVHMLSTGAFNALLKTLEEPPSQVVFILATTELHKVPITVRSRCMIFSFKKIDTSIIVSHLKNILQKESITFEDDAIHIIAREAKGSLRDSLSLLEQAIAICGGSHLSTKETKQGLCVQGEQIAENLFTAICEKNTENAFCALQEASMASLDIATIMENTAGLFRQALLIKSMGDKERTLRLAQLLPNEYDFLYDKSKKFTSSALSEVFKALSQSVREISRSTAPLAWAEVTVVDCILRADWLSASEILTLLKNEPIEPNRSIKSQSNNSIPSSITAAVSQDMALFRNFVEVIRKKSDVLATKMNFVKIVEFNKNKIEFADTQDNATYLTLNDLDNKIFWDSVKEMGLESAELKGRFFPAKAPNVKESAKNILKNFQKLTGSQPTTTTISPDNQAKTVSLNEVILEEKTKAHLEKEKMILAREGVQELKKLATDIQILEFK